jgi:flavin-dependent dehydrogenase
MTADVAIVGGGPAGAATALALARRGVAVTVVERTDFPRRKVCGEYVNAGALAELDALGLGAAVHSGGSALQGVRLIASGASSVELIFPRPALAIARERLDAIVLDAACSAGATLVHGRVEDVLFENGRAAGVAFRDRSGERQELPARFVVGADGIGSIVGRKLGLCHPPADRARYAIGGHYRGVVDQTSFVEMYAAGGAYFAINPLSEDLANVMVVVRKSALATWSGAIDERMGGKAAELGRGHRDFSRAVRVGPRVSIGPLSHRVTHVARPGALLVGDAAGFLNPFTGQGIFLALVRARRAADTIAAALATRAGEERRLREYEETLRADMRVRARVSAVVDALVDVPFLARRAALRVRRFPQIANALLEVLSGSQTPQKALPYAVFARLLL